MSYSNEQIRAKEVRLIDENGEQMGVVETKKALQLAMERNLDLVQITEKVEPPVCKIMDYGKYIYRQEKKKRKSGQKKTTQELKNIRISYTISEHDLKTKANQAGGMLKEGNKIRIEMRLIGRQKGLTDFAKDKLQKFIKMISEVQNCKIEKEIKKESRGLTTIITIDKDIIKEN